MNDNEFDLLDELYFVQSYKEIKEALQWGDDKLIESLFSLYCKGFIKVLIAQDEEYSSNISTPQQVKWEEMYYLATKKGLLEHNGF
ncbi:hypothetical protein JKA74_14825 [Marivirga sp. S37H4]|uniref:Uncharacterized protein n=2 Tax=Marivirga aurantiaca TaxID=2802615 RepID=A0A934WZY2_9BACT|nr:hypothetical protein [Marivirga aurantiaca]MBK6266318.1 hypothetical protein [Marivirga aurantiaca]